MYGNFTHSRAEGSFLFEKRSRFRRHVREAPGYFCPQREELWSFALNAVVNDIRRKQPGVLYLCERMTNVHRVLTLRYGDDRDRLNEAETAEYSKLLMTFSFEEMSEVRKLYHWYDRVGDLQPADYSCDACHTSLYELEWFCMDCVSTDKESGCWSRTVDFCGKPECIATESLPNRTDESFSMHDSKSWRQG
ncbi:hypothetical protein B0H14DRAFT_2649840 [Mycena olivaceomarginata]|nr:hypothetical protein B0H14DRAFT_2649840 [Mycena olivaceomarginata]